MNNPGPGCATVRITNPRVKRVILALDAVFWQQLFTLLCNVERNRAAFEKYQTVFFDRRRLAERLALEERDLLARHGAQAERVRQLGQELAQIERELST